MSYSLPPPHEFEERLAFSEGVISECLMDRIVSALPTSTGYEKATLADDRSGTDYWLHRKDGLRSLSVDLKNRGFCPIEKFGSDDACIETTSVYQGPAGNSWSDKHRRKVGWTIDENKQTDYVVYTWPEGTARRYWIVPYPFLQAASIRWWRQWAIDYGEKPAVNETYLTLSVYPPRQVIAKAMRSLMVGRVQIHVQPLPETAITQHQLGFNW